MKRFEKKTAVITGGASGMGKATCLRLSSEGANIIIIDRDEAKSLELVNKINNEGGSAHFIKTDLSDYGSIQKMAQEVNANFESIHILVNAAGIGSTSSVEEVKSGDWEPIAAINLRAPLTISAALLPLLKKEGGSIVNISSDGGLRARNFCPVYDATKAGLISLSNSMAAGYVKYGIRVNAIAPGWAVTEFHYGNDENKKQEMLEMDTDYCMMRRLARPEEIASAIAFLASDDASYITGITLNVDGGRVGFDF